METITDLIARRNIRMTIKRAESNPNMTDSVGMTHWRCHLQNDNGHRIQIVFSMGQAHQSGPSTADVLDCMASDASGIENSESFEAWAAEYGYDTDSRAAERTYKACKRQTEQLKSLLGADYTNLLFDVERL